MEVSGHGGTSNNLMVFVREDPKQEMDDDWGYPHLWKHYLGYDDIIVGQD